MSLRFEWDPKKATANVSKHRVSFEEALTVFADPLARIFEDEDDPAGRSREIIVGHSAANRLLAVCFAAHEQVVRIVSARKATRIERKDYEEGVKS